VLAACSGAPPPPVARASASPHELHPLSSRESDLPSITGRVRVAPGLHPPATAVLYVIARRGDSTIAVRRIDRPHFPFAFELSGADAMRPGIRFDGPLDLIARVSRSGDAIPAKGDLEGTIRNARVPSKDVLITIDTIHP
jgi:cytochrome c-type biogenesis protein CcmH